MHSYNPFQAAKAASLNEAKKTLSPADKKKLKALIDRVYDASDPSNYDPELENVDDLIELIRKSFGSVIADTVDSGTYIMHFPRPNHQYGSGEYDWSARNNRRITKDGKVNKTDVRVMKQEIKAKLGLDEAK
jgi:hypothetical protein|tara:strand:- start:29 stop:424 length:396 start_codon:yes stop_codon:yes gene_type:complete